MVDLHLRDHYHQQQPQLLHHQHQLPHRQHQLLHQQQHQFLHHQHLNHSNHHIGSSLTWEGGVQVSLESKEKREVVKKENKVG